MAAGTVRISDVIVPSIFTPYVQQLTMEKTAILQSGAAVIDPALTALLAGGGLTFNVPSWRDLDNDAENVASDDPAVTSSPNKVGTAREIAVRLTRNNSWATMDLVSDLAGDDPAAAIANRLAAYWARRQQAALIATLNGVFAMNAAAPAGSSTHVANDMLRDIKGASFVAGTTDFSATAFIDACLTMGDAMGDLALVIMHSVVYAKAQKNNLIDFVPDSRGEVNIPTFLGRRVIVDDGMPFSGGVYDTWLFGAGAIRMGIGSPDMPTEILRVPAAGRGSGQEILWNRVSWVIHPGGHAYVGTPADQGGPTNAATTNNLAVATSWERRFPERKQIKIARLVTRES
jgi:hypothetical protein